MVGGLLCVQHCCPTGRQTKILQLKKSIKFENFTSNAHFACINFDWPTAIIFKIMAIVNKTILIVELFYLFTEALISLWMPTIVCDGTWSVAS